MQGRYTSPGTLHPAQCCMYPSQDPLVGAHIPPPAPVYTPSVSLYTRHMRHNVTFDGLPEGPSVLYSGFEEGALRGEKSRKDQNLSF